MVKIVGGAAALETTQIEEIERRRSTLEDVFIRTVEETKQEPGEAAQGTP